MKIHIVGAFISSLLLVTAACVGTTPPSTVTDAQPTDVQTLAQAVPSPSPTSTVEPTNTPMPEPTATATSTSVPTATATVPPTATSSPVPTSTPEPTATPFPTATPEPTATPTPSPTPMPLTPSEIFDLVSPSVAFVENAIWSGSGVLIEGGYIVTNAHVVWPYREARIVFPDGSEFLDTPVVAWDQLIDLAILGPIEAEAEALRLVDAEEIVIGSDTYLIGYPGEGEEFPQPTITRGLVSRLREWEPAGITFFQTDAAIAGGQSGGALVSERGEVIGISEFFFTEGGFGLVASAADLTEKIDGMIAGDDLSEFGDRRLLETKGSRKHNLSLDNIWDAQAFVLNEPVDTEVELEVRGLFPIVAVFDIFGRQIDLLGTFGTDLRTTSFEVELEAPYFVFPLSENLNTDLGLKSNKNLVAFPDPDDDHNLEFGTQFAGILDHPFDIDFFNIELAEGDKIDITVDSMFVDPVLAIGFKNSRVEERRQDDDSGEGIFGTNAKLTYEAPHSGSFLIMASDANLIQTGGYFITVVSPEAESQSEAYANSLAESGNAHRRAGESEKAIRLLSRAIELDPSLANAYKYRASAYFSDDSFDLAMADISRAIEISSDDATLYRRRGGYHWQLGDYEAALIDLDAAIERDSEYASAYNMRSLTNSAMGNHEQALEDANTALSHQRRDNNYIKDTRAYVYLKLREYDRALTEYRLIQDEFRGSPYNDLGIGLAYAGLEDTKKAEDFLEKGLREAKDSSSPDPQLADLIAMATEALNSL